MSLLSKLEASFAYFDDENDEPIVPPVIPEKKKIKTHELANFYPEFSVDSLLYTGPIGMITNEMGRCIIAETDIEAGTCLMIEKPLLTWNHVQLPELERNNISTENTKEKDDLTYLYSCLVSILNHPNKDKILSGLEHLYPNRDQMNRVSKTCVERMLAMNPYLKHLNEMFNHNLDDLNRLCFVLSFNAFSSGMYLSLSMFNHGYKANCLKLSENGVSKVVALRKINKLDECVICYTSPHISKHRDRQLMSQFDVYPDESESLFTCKSCDLAVSQLDNCKCGYLLSPKERSVRNNLAWELEKQLCNIEFSPKSSIKMLNSLINELTSLEDKLLSIFHSTSIVVFNFFLKKCRALFLLSRNEELLDLLDGIFELSIYHYDINSWYFIELLETQVENYKAVLCRTEDASSKEFLSIKIQTAEKRLLHLIEIYK